MKYLQLLNWLLFAAGALMALVLGVVSMILYIYQEPASNIGTNLTLVTVTWLVFTAFTMVSGLAAWTLYRRHPLMWLGQAGLATGVAGLVLFSQLLGQI